MISENSGYLCSPYNKLIVFSSKSTPLYKRTVLAALDGDENGCMCKVIFHDVDLSIPFRMY